MTLQVRLGLVEAEEQAGCVGELVRKLRKPKAFKAATEARRRARASVGPTPPSRAFDEQKGRPPKHKKRARQDAIEA